MARSLRSQLLVHIALTTLLVFSIAAATTFVLLRNSLLDEFDSLLDAKVQAMAKLVEQDHDKLRIEFVEHQLHEFVRDQAREYYEVWDANGRVIARSPHLGKYDLLDDPKQMAEETVFAFAELPDGRRGRITATKFVPIIDDESLLASDSAVTQSVKPMTLAIACGTEAIDQTVERIAWIFFIASAAALVLLVSALAWSVVRAIRPLKRLAAQIESVDEHSLNTRFDVTGTPSEIVPVVARANRLMGRLEQAFLRERTLTADIAHELRTPLAGLRSTIQVTLSKPRERSEYRSALDECESMCRGMQQLVETLLSLARLEQDNSREEWSYSEIGVLVDNIWRAFETPSQERALRVKRHGPEAVFLQSDSNKLHVVLSNLFDNAVTHANSGGEISIVWSVGNQGLTLRIANTGCALDADQMEHVFERFWRGDSARADTGTHAGLGLALCRKIVESLDGTIVAKCRNGVFEVVLAFGETYVDQVDCTERQYAGPLLTDSSAI